MKMLGFFVVIINVVIILGVLSFSFSTYLAKLFLFIPWIQTKPVFILAWPVKTMVAAINTSILIILVIFLGVEPAVQF